MKQNAILIAVDSVGVDPLGHPHPESIYRNSRFLFPQGQTGDLIPLSDYPYPARWLKRMSRTGSQAEQSNVL